MYDTIQPSVLAGRLGCRYRLVVQAVSIGRLVVRFYWVRRNEDALVAVETFKRSSRFAVRRANHSTIKCRATKNFIVSHYIQNIGINTYTLDELYWVNYTRKWSWQLLPSRPSYRFYFRPLSVVVFTGRFDWAVYFFLTTYSIWPVNLFRPWFRIGQLIYFFRCFDWAAQSFLTVVKMPPDATGEKMKTFLYPTIC